MIFGLFLTMNSDFFDDFDLFNEQPIRRRIYHERVNPLDQWDDSDFKKRFRMRKSSFHKLLGLIENELTFISNRNNPVSPSLQLLIAIRYYACGTFQQVCGDLVRISQPTMSRVVKKVSIAIAKMLPRFIKFPSKEQAMKVSHAGEIEGYLTYFCFRTFRASIE